MSSIFIVTGTDAEGRVSKFTRFDDDAPAEIEAELAVARRQLVERSGAIEALATARQTLDSRAGDCTEHTMLAVSLARAAGIPARILAGVVWQRDAFYYHFWYEAYVGEWVALDPTLGQTPADARHIQLSGGALESDTALEFGEGILRTLNRLELRTAD